MPNHELGAYFYPLTVQCPERLKRAKQLGYLPVDETELVKKATPLFDGHQQPNTYCLDAETTNWDDSCPDALARQIELAQEHGLSYFIFDTYVGHKEGKPVKEMIAPVNNFVSMKPRGFQFACMAVLGSPRVVLPVPRDPNFEEPNRYYDKTQESIHFLVDCLATNYWSSSNYMLINGRPYLPIFTSDMSPVSNELSLPELIEEIKRYSHAQYNVDPWVAGVIRKVKSATELIKAGADSLTGYAFLPKFGKGADVIQSYPNRIEEVKAEWDETQLFCQANGIFFQPPAVVGWDASPRGITGCSMSEVTGIYPYTPVLVGSTASSFARHLEAVIQYNISYHSVKGPVRTTICAWDEVTEGAALLPRLVDNEVNYDYLCVVKELQNTYAWAIPTMIQMNE